MLGKILVGCIDRKSWCQSKAVLKVIFERFFPSKTGGATPMRLTLLT